MREPCCLSPVNLYLTGNHKNFLQILTQGLYQDRRQKNDLVLILCTVQQVEEWQWEGADDIPLREPITQRDCWGHLTSTLPWRGKNSTQNCTRASH